MGTVNYGTGEYITLAYQPVEDDSQENQEKFGDLYLNMKVDSIFNEYGDFEFLEVIRDNGYYEGFYVAINTGDLVGAGFYNKDQMLDAFLELERVRKLLVELLDAGLFVCHPGWCTGWLNYGESLNEINQCIAKISSDISITPVYLEV